MVRLTSNNNRAKNKIKTQYNLFISFFSSKLQQKISVNLYLYSYRIYLKGSSKKFIRILLLRIKKATKRDSSSLMNI